MTIEKIFDTYILAQCYFPKLKAEAAKSRWYRHQRAGKITTEKLKAAKIRYCENQIAVYQSALEKLGKE